MRAYLSRFGIKYEDWVSGYNKRAGFCDYVFHQFRPLTQGYVPKYRHGIEIPEWAMFQLSDSDHANRYVNGHEIPEDKMYLIDIVAYGLRYEFGGSIPKDAMQYMNEFNLKKRMCSGYDPECRSARLSYQLGYRIQENVKIDIEPHDHVVRRNRKLVEACILALDGYPIAIPREFAADFEYVTGLAAPTWLELCDPAGEVVFRAEDPANCQAADARIDQVCDHLCSPEWGARRVGDMRGVIIMVAR